MANMNIYKNCYMMFCTIDLTISAILTLKMFDLENLGQGHGVQLSQLPHSMANIKIYKRHLLHVGFFAQIRPVVIQVTHAHKNTDTENG